MSYRIEYLTETTEEDTVCFSMMSSSHDLPSVEQEAEEHSASAKMLGATGYQIRHLNAVDRILTISNFDD